MSHGVYTQPGGPRATAPVSEILGNGVAVWACRVLPDGLRPQRAFDHDFGPRNAARRGGHASRHFDGTALQSARYRELVRVAVDIGFSTACREHEMWCDTDVDRNRE